MCFVPHVGLEDSICNGCTEMTIVPIELSNDPKVGQPTDIFSQLGGFFFYRHVFVASERPA
jgi:hypothetical protein